MGSDPAAARNYLNSIPDMDANTRAQAGSDFAATGSLAGSVRSLPPDQRQAGWVMRGDRRCSLPA